MAAAGLLTIFLATTAIPARLKGTGIILLLAGLATVVTTTNAGDCSTVHLHERFQSLSVALNPQYPP